MSLRWRWMSRTTWRCTRWKRWSPMSGQRLIVLTLDFSSFTQSLVLVIIHVFHLTSKMFFAMGDDLSYGLNTLGPLCLWQCFLPQGVLTNRIHAQVAKSSFPFDFNTISRGTTTEYSLQDLEEMYCVKIWTISGPF